MIYRELKLEELDISLWESFIRHQVVDKCWCKENGKWVIKSEPFVDDWKEQEYNFLVQCLKNTISQGGVVYGAFEENKLKGFVSVEGEIFGQDKYMDLTSIHVSEDMRGHGIGKELFKIAKAFAKDKGAKKLYISAHSAVETQAFYKAMGCVEARVYNQAYVEAEPYDCQLECML